MKLLILTGPTAAGKTALSLLLAKQLQGEIINADMGQFYKAFSVGTAKPDWQKSSIPHHLFDCVTTPTDTSVVAYRKMVLTAIDDCVSRGKQPILVGGSLFYIKSLFYPPLITATATEAIPDKEATWDALNAIDPERASSIKKNDTYRIKRALHLFYATGELPSSFEPQFTPLYDSLVVFLNPPRTVLYKNINDRCEEMLKDGVGLSAEAVNSAKRHPPTHKATEDRGSRPKFIEALAKADGGGGWADEVEKCIGTDWEAFIEHKGLIGYREILSWIREGKKQDAYEALKELIKQKTRNYAKRQEIFWKKFSHQLITASEKNGIKVLPFSVLPEQPEQTAVAILEAFEKMELRSDENCFILTLAYRNKKVAEWE